MADITYRLDRELIIVPVTIYGPAHFFKANFVLDTGASNTIIDYRVAESIGYSKQDSVAPSRVSSATGKEEGYRLKIGSIEALGEKISPFEVACHRLYEQGVEGLLGMTFLKNFDFCIFPSKRIIRIA